MKNETYQLFTSRQTDAGLEKNEASFWILIIHTRIHTYIHQNPDYLTFSSFQLFFIIQKFKFMVMFRL